MRTNEAPCFADITVITPAYCARETIGRALASIARQSLKPVAAIVVDDGSDDGTYEAAQGWTDRMNGVALNVIAQENAGPGAARNRALAAAKTEFVAFLDADDEWLPEKLRRSMAHFDCDDIVLVSHNFHCIEAGKETLIDCARRLPQDSDPYTVLFRGNFISTSSVVARRKAVIAAGGFDESLPSAQDYELWLSMANASKAKFRIFADALTRYHVIGNSISSDIETRRRCALSILGGQLEPMHRRRRFPLLSTWLRTLLIARETFGAYRGRNDAIGAAWALLRLPADLIVISWRLFRVMMRSGDTPPQFGDIGIREDLETTDAIKATRDAVSETVGDPRERNRQWWERLPMTYAAWGADNRIPSTAEDFLAIRRRIYAASPFFRERFDATRLKDLEVLDLGCGSGAFSSILAEGGAKVTAVDLTEAAVTITRKGAALLGHRIPVSRMDAERLAIADKSFDYVFSWGVLHHTHDTARAFREVAGILKPGGAGLIMVYHKSSIVYYLYGLYWLLVKGKILKGYNLQTVQDFYIDGYYHRHYTRTELADALTAAGLRVDRVFVTQMQKKIVPFLPVWLDETLKQRFGWLICAEFGRTQDKADTMRNSPCK